MSNFHRHLLLSVETSGKIYSQQSKEYVSRWVREAAPLSLSSNDSGIASPLPRHSTDDTRHLEVEIQRCAIEKARERMELELCKGGGEVHVRGGGRVSACVDLVSRRKGPFAERPDYRVPQLVPPPLDT